MSATQRGAIPAPLRKTLLEWIDIDDGDTTSTKPACSADIETLHAQVLAPNSGRGIAEPIQPPPGLRLAPLG